MAAPLSREDKARLRELVENYLLGAWRDAFEPNGMSPGMLGLAYQGKCVLCLYCHRMAVAVQQSPGCALATACRARNAGVTTPPRIQKELCVGYGQDHLLISLIPLT